MFRADLHCHSSCSDGSVAPADLVALAKSVGLAGLSITDHDTIDAYAEAIPAAYQSGIRLGSGVELSCALNGSSVHILGYDFSLDDEGLKNLCAQHKVRRLKRNRTILKKLERLNMPIPEAELKQLEVGNRTIGRPHIAQLMVEKKYVASIKEAFSLYLGDGKCCYDPGEPFSVPETIQLIQQAGGKAFIAHPHLVDNPKILCELLKMRFDGIECYYAKFSTEKEKRWLKIAKERGLLVSGGSDFHGEIKPQIPLGSSWVDEDTFNQVFEHPLT